MRAANGGCGPFAGGWLGLGGAARGHPRRGAALHGDGAALLQNGMLSFGLGDAGLSPHVMEGIAARKYF